VSEYLYQNLLKFGNILKLQSTIVPKI